MYENFNEEIYIKIPAGFKLYVNLACKLNKSIYGFKQASNSRFDAFFKSLSRQQTNTDKMFIYLHKA